MKNLFSRILKFTLFWKICIIETVSYFAFLIFLFLLLGDYPVSLFTILSVIFLLTVIFFLRQKIIAENKNTTDEKIGTNLTKSLSLFLEKQKKQQIVIIEKVLEGVIEEENKRIELILKKIHSSQKGTFNLLEEKIKNLSEVCISFKKMLETTNKQNQLLIDKMTALHKEDIKSLEKLLND